MESSRAALSRRVGIGLATTAALIVSAPARAFDPADATDINPDPAIVEINLTASETTWQYVSGVDTPVWAYNDQVPGPTIRANVGDTLIVHFTNNLPEDTTIHWHGVELPATMDGSNISQLTIPPGGTFDYQFDLLRDGMYWYHPHVRTFDQIEKGLHGVLLVHDPQKEADLGLDQIEEHIVVFDDILLDENFEVVPAFSFDDPLDNALYHLNGREGNYLLVNGREVSEVTLEVANGQPLRWRVLNAANTTICRLDLNDLGVSVWQLGTDGGFLEEPFLRDPVVEFPLGPIGGGQHPTSDLFVKTWEGIYLMPGERMDVVFTPIGNDGDQWTFDQMDWFRGRHIAIFGPDGEILLPDDPMDGLYPPQPYFTLALQGADPGTGEWDPPAVLSDFDLPANPVGMLPVTLGHGLPDKSTGDITLFAQSTMENGALKPLPAPVIDSFIASDVNVGETWQWEIVNLTHGDHPFHAHGFFFIPYEIQWIDEVDPSFNQTINLLPNPNTRGKLELRDTFRAPARSGARGTSRSIVRAMVVFDDTGREGLTEAHGTTPTFYPDGSFVSGGWLFHCHILEHSAKGMLSFFEVHDPAVNPFVFLGKGMPGPRGENLYLTAEGDLDAEGDVTLTVINAEANSEVVLLFGFQVADSRMGRTGGPALVPQIESTFTATADAEGTASWSTDFWVPYPAGTEFYFQVVSRVIGGAVPDPPGLPSWEISNALMFTRPDTPSITSRRHREPPPAVSLRPPNR